MKKFLAFCSVLGLFVASSVLASQYHAPIAQLVERGGAAASLFFILIEIGGVIVAPFNTVVFTPLAVAAWGPLVAAGLSLTGWTIGSVLAYHLARRYGQPLIGKLNGLHKIEEITHVLPASNLFWSVVVLRILIPADLVSYALGLFTPMTTWAFALATLLGNIPSALAYSYGATIAPGYQLALALVMFVLLGLGYRHYLTLSQRPH